MYQTVNNNTGKENHEQILVRENYVFLSLDQNENYFYYNYTFDNIVVSTEQYVDPPLYDLRFPDKKDLVNYTKSKDISEITIPSSFVKERDQEMNKNGEYNNYIL